MDSDSNDFVSGFNLALTRDGQGEPTATLPMSGFRHTNVGDGLALTDYSSVKQVQQNSLQFAVAGGTSDALSVTLSPSPTLVDGMQILVRAIAANATTNPTLTLNGGSSLLITKFGGSALAAGDIVGALHELNLRYNSAHTRWELLNPAPTAVVGAALVASANVFTADQTIQSTDAGAGAAPNLNLDRFSASPAASDVLALLRFLGRSSTAVQREYAGILANILDPTNASEDARLDLRTIVNGVAAARFSVGQGIWTPNATGGDKGLDTANLSALYANGLRIKDNRITNVAALSSPSASAIDGGLIVNTGGGAFTTTLPATAGVSQGSVVSIVHNGSGRWTLAASGSDAFQSANTSLSTLLLSPGDNGYLTLVGTVWVWTGNRTFVSASYSFSAGSLHTFAHGLGVSLASTWSAFISFATCNSADNGFSPGDVYEIFSGVQVDPDNVTNFLLRDYAGAPSITVKNTGANGTMTTTKWTFQISAFVRN